MKPIAVFLDGFTYHHDRIGQDMAQRMAIVQCGKFHIWSLTWHEVENKFKPQKNFFEDYMDPAGLPSGGNLNQLLDGYGLSRNKKIIKYNSFDLLIHFLENPDEEKWQRLMFVAALLHVDPKQFKNEGIVKDWMGAIDALLPEDMAEKIKEADCPNLSESCLYCSKEHKSQDGNIFVKQFLVVEKKALEPPGEPMGVRVGCFLNDAEEAKNKTDFQSCWNGFLRLYNYFQFLPYSYFVTSEGNKLNAYDGIKLFDETATRLAIPEEENVGDKWDQIKEITDEQFHGLLDLLKENKWSIPEAGYELEGRSGEIIASAELVWKRLKLALLTEEELEYANKFEDFGWKVIPISEILGDPEKYMSLRDQ